MRYSGCALCAGWWTAPAQSSASTVCKRRASGKKALRKGREAQTNGNFLTIVIQIKWINSVAVLLTLDVSRPFFAVEKTLEPAKHYNQKNRTRKWPRCLSCGWHILVKSNWYGPNRPLFFWDDQPYMVVYNVWKVLWMLTRALGFDPRPHECVNSCPTLYT